MNQIINITDNKDSTRNLGKKQWDCIDALAEHYKDSNMSSISATSNFSDGVWDVFGTDEYNFKWNDWLKDESAYPLLIACKVAAYNKLQISNLAVSTIQKEISGFINAFFDTLQPKSILIAERNQPFNGLSQLSSYDIQLVAQSTIAKNSGLSVSTYSCLNRFSTIPIDFFPNSSFLVSGISTPWQEQSLSCQAWVKQIKKIHGLDVTTKSYAPLKFEVVSSIVKNALPFIDEYFDTIVDVFDEIEEFHKENPPKKGRKVNLNVGSIIQKKYKRKLESILPLRLVESKTNHTGMITQGWYSEFEQLSQGAAAWIILLTTGLRNVDMRNLEKGCCQPSKRHNLLNYLITDIKKTHLQNYVVPVPPQTKKAVQLAELSKIDRSGSVLFQKNNTKSSDKSSEKRKMNTGEPFNRLIQNFASRYNISLKTISQNEDEATAHCIRATLAGYIGANSAAAILILKKLFGHSNALMPDAYLSHNPVVIAERNKNITNSQESLAEDMAQGMVSGKLSGTKGKQMLIGAEHIEKDLRVEFENKSVTEMDMQIELKGRIKEMLLSRIKENQIYALKTPMSVACIRSCSDSSDTPCAKLPNREKRKESGINKEITDALATLPNPAHCIGKECSDALFGEAWSRDLLGTFDYYIKYLKGIGHQSVDIKNEAELFVKNYGSILKDIYADERGDGYFD
ncbi:site-specific integrase [Pseudoalteromonas denitrificans]|uniref:Phage integrase family protein n=1 Tax=Pseudoalteromonas denitrificans DSM 6059 TaxID=1123010 RepID=A0A1I1ILH3_9GAMM|nr:site-specific integrase [Pseudoalteromonas denitrificans]SFC37067.1 hypothetical protein SAMN02745724_01525 [Pseudoalteromonas denitrificans DSM 6059]